MAGRREKESERGVEREEAEGERGKGKKEVGESEGKRREAGQRFAWRMEDVKIRRRLGGGAG